jgi:hypothetical protein
MGTKMPYEVSYDKEDNIVLLRAFGTVTHEEHEAARRQAVQLCSENGCTRILADLLELDTKKSSTQNCFDYGEALAQENISYSTCIAIVLPTDINSIEDIQFATTVAANRGRPTFRFKTVEEAKQWLRRT